MAKTASKVQKLNTRRVPIGRVYGIYKEKKKEKKTPLCPDHIIAIYVDW